MIELAISPADQLEKAISIVNGFAIVTSAYRTDSDVPNTPQPELRGTIKFVDISEVYDSLLECAKGDGGLGPFLHGLLRCYYLGRSDFAAVDGGDTGVDLQIVAEVRVGYIRY